MKDGEMERRKTKISLHTPFFTSTEGRREKKIAILELLWFMCMHTRNNTKAET